MSKISRLKERPAWCSRQAGIVKAQDPRAGQLVAVQAHSLGSRGAAGSENRGGLGTEARSALQPLARAPRPLHHRRCAAPSSGLAAQAHGAPNPGSYDEVQSGTLAPCYSSPDSCCPTIVAALSSPRPPCSLFTHSYDAMPTLERLGRPCMQHARRGRKATAACEEDKSQLRFVQHSVVVSAISWHGLLSLLLLSHPLRRNACDCTADAPGTVQGRKPEAATCEWSPDQTGVCRMQLHHCGRPVAALDASSVSGAHSGRLGGRCTAPRPAVVEQAQ